VVGTWGPKWTVWIDDTVCAHADLYANIETTSDTTHNDLVELYASTIEQ
jgi:hypothetical protein